MIHRLTAYLDCTNTDKCNVTNVKNAVELTAVYLLTGYTKKQSVYKPYDYKFNYFSGSASSYKTHQDYSRVFGWLLGDCYVAGPKPYRNTSFKHSLS